MQVVSKNIDVKQAFFVITWLLTPRNAYFLLYPSVIAAQGEAMNLSVVLVNQFMVCIKWTPWRCLIRSGLKNCFPTHTAAVKSWILGELSNVNHFGNAAA